MRSSVSKCALKAKQTAIPAKNSLKSDTHILVGVRNYAI
jgi:hypothetical protein